MRAHWRGDIRQARSVGPAMVIALALLPAIGGPAAAATAVGTFSVSLVIRPTCDIASTHARDFRIAVQCTHPTPYRVALDGSASGTALSARAITGGIASSDPLEDATTTVQANSATYSGNPGVPDPPMPPPAVHGHTVRVTITY